MKEKRLLRGPLSHYIRWPAYLTGLLIVLNAIVYVFDTKAGLVLSLGLLIYVGMIIILYARYRPMLFNELLAYSANIDTLGRNMIEKLNVPYALCDEQGRILWCNAAFTLLLGSGDWYNKNVTSFIPELNAERLNELCALLAEGKATEDWFIEQKGQIFRVMTGKLTNADLVYSNDEISDILKQEHTLIFVYLLDETEVSEYIQKCEDEKTAVGMIYIDNYEEAMESVEEVRRSLLNALIDRRIAKYFASYDGLVKKLEKDKYFLVFRQKALEEMRAQRFGILEEIKSVNIGNEMAVTLSIGVGINASGMVQNYEYCRTAIEMALGRGGDQAVVKDAGSITYYGGNSLQVEKNTRVKARVKAQALKEFMAVKDRVVVMGHKLTDVDALGAAIGIYRAGRTMNKPVHIVVNDPTTSIRPLMEGFLDNADYDQEMFIGSARAKELVDNSCLVVVVDTSKPSYTECMDLLHMTKTVVVLDHHRRGNEIIENAVLSYVEPYASSACEMVAEILQYFSDGLKLRTIEADCLYAGIVIDTNNFITRSGVRTFEAAAYLRRCGADPTRVRKLLRDNIDSYKAKAETVYGAEIYRQFFAIGVCPSKGLESPTVTGAQAANELLNIADVKASFVMTDYQDEVYVSARAIDEVNVQVMMEKMGGGGHMNIAGAQSKSSLEITKERIKEIIDEFIEEGGIGK